jgi:L-lactate dehydrogenase complex protein LldG
MSAAKGTAMRDSILTRIRQNLPNDGSHMDRQAVVAERLAQHRPGPVPARAEGSAAERLALFTQMMESQSATVLSVDRADEVPGVIAGYLRQHNLPARLRHGADSFFDRLAWDQEPALERSIGPAGRSDTVGVSRASVAAAETGTVFMCSGSDNPVTINFLPDTHIVVLQESCLTGSYEQAWAKIRESYGEGAMPRTVNLISGPSRTGDIEQTIIMGAHGPRQVCVIVVKDKDGTSS